MHSKDTGRHVLDVCDVRCIGVLPSELLPEVEEVVEVLWDWDPLVGGLWVDALSHVELAIGQKAEGLPVLTHQFGRQIVVELRK